MSKTRQDLYKLRRENLRPLLNYGDIKRLAEKLLAMYPDASKSGVKDYANYLTQVFNLNSKKPFKEELARRIETVWGGLSQGELDVSVEERLKLEDHEKDEMYLEFEREQEALYQDEIESKRLRDLENGRKADSIMPLIAQDALKWRLTEEFIHPVLIESNKVLKLKSGDYIADFVVSNKETKKTIALVETGQYITGLAQLQKKAHLNFLMKESSVSRGYLAIYDGTDISLNRIQGDS